MKRILSAALPLLVLAALGGCSDSGQSPTGPTADPARGPLSSNDAPGSVSDPTGDSLDNPRTDPDPDLVSAQVLCDAEYVHLEARVAPATFDPDSTSLTFNLDVDRDPGTGFPGVTAANSDAAIMGVEFVVFLNYYDDLATVLRFDALPSDFSLVGNYPLTTLADGFSAAIPRADLGETQGAIHYKVTGSARLFGGTTGVLDVMPDLGLPAGVSTACPQVLEIDLRPDGASPPINCRNPNKLITLILPGSEDFDVSQVDHASIRFAGTGEWHVNKRTGEVKRHEGESNGDGFADLVLHFRLSDTDLDCASTEAELTGMFLDGTEFLATVAITMNDPSHEGITP